MQTALKKIQNRYKIEHEFLQCRYSTLYHATDQISNLPVVVRKLHDSLPSEDPVVRRDARIQILREGRALAKLQHRNLPPVLEIIEEDNNIYLLLENFKGQTLQDMMKEKAEPLDERLLIRWFGQLLSAVEYLHSRIPPIIHRDLHPGSILVSPHGVLKIAEFGLARISETEETGKTLFRAQGHKNFAAPEQLMQEPSDVSNDIYSVGAIMYYLATNAVPRSSLDRFKNPEGDNSISSLNPSISGEFAGLIMKMMEPDRKKRFATIYEVQERFLETIPAGLSISISLPRLINQVQAKPAPSIMESKPAITCIPERQAQEILKDDLKDERKKSGWDDFFNLPAWFGKGKEVRATPESAPKQEEVQKFPFIDLGAIQIDREIGRILPEAISKSIEGICIGTRFGKELTVAVNDPTQVHIFDHVSYATKGTYKPVIVRADETLINLAREYIYKGVVGSTSKTWLEWLTQKKYESDKLDVKTVSDEANIFQDDIKGPVIEALDRIIKEAISIGASDIHMESFDTEMVVRYRIDGVLHIMQTFSPMMAAAIVKRLKLTAGMDIAQDRITQGGRLSVKVRDREFDLRISVVPVPTGENIVMRLLNKGAFNYKLADLGFDTDSENRYRTLLSAPHGMILVSGPTGSGKSTTLYASLSEINRPDRKLITVEDPIEYQMAGITQVQVNLAPKEDEKKVTFAKALKEFLRQDPDVLLVGEIRDRETAAIAVQCALTGHLLLSTIHTNDSIGIVTRLEDLGVESYLVSSTLVGGIAQRLVRKVCSKCREQVEPGRNLKERFAAEGITEYTVFQGKGCLECSHTGNKGRLALYEILEVTPEIRELIADRAGFDAILKEAQKHGLKTLYQDSLKKVAKGQITFDEALRVTVGGH